MINVIYDELQKISENIEASVSGSGFICTIEDECFPIRMSFRQNQVDMFNNDAGSVVITYFDKPVMSVNCKKFDSKYWEKVQKMCDKYVQLRYQYYFAMNAVGDEQEADTDD